MHNEFTEDDLKVIEKSKNRIHNWSKYRIVFLIGIIIYISIALILIYFDPKEFSIPLKFIVSGAWGGVFLGALIKNWNGPIKDKIIAKL